MFPKTNGTFNSKLTWLGVFLVLIVVLAFVWDKRDKNED
ncbi:LPXTG cell wall anchor domain-containing protein [Enterococcus faecalis]